MFNKAGKYSGTFTAVYKPTITSPTASQIVASRTPTITGSAFSKYGNITHASTDWQVSDSIDFTTIRWSSPTDATNKTSIVTADLAGGDRYVRVRYRASNGVVSEWSDGVLFTSPWASGSNATLTSSTNMDVNASTTITLQPGTYRVTLWGGAGGKGANGSSGGGGGCVYKEVTYTNIQGTEVPITIGTGGRFGNGECQSNPCTQAPGGSPGGGNGAGSGDWRGGGGGGYSSALGMIAGGGGGGSSGGGYATGGGQNPSEGGNSSAGFGGAGCAGPGGSSGSAGSSGGGGGGGSHASGNFESACESGNGGANSGSLNAYPASGSTPGNPYFSSTYGRTFGAGTGGTGNDGGARIERIPPQNTPVVSITSNLATTYTATAGGSNNFSITATDTANNNSTVSYQWYLSTNGGSSYSAISGATSSTLTRYNPFYYNDNGHKIKCRATVTNSVGTNYVESNVCTLTVNRNFDCNSTEVTGSQQISATGFKPSATSVDEQWGNDINMVFSDICDINGYVASSDGSTGFLAGGRCDYCRVANAYQGWQLRLELRITKSTDGTKKYSGSWDESNTNCDAAGTKPYKFSSNGGSWNPESDGTPVFKLFALADGTECQYGAGQNIGARQDSTAYVYYTYKRRTYYYETRP